MLYTTQNLSSLKTSPMRIFHKVRNLNKGSHNFKMRLSITKVMQLQKKKQSRKHLTLPALILFRSQCPIPVLTFLVLIRQKSFRCVLLAICTDCRKIYSKDISQKRIGCTLRKLDNMCYLKDVF